MTEITFNIKPQAGGDDFSVTITQESTVAQLKDQINEKTSIGKEHMRLIFKGRILKDEQTLSEAKLEAGMTVVLVNTNTEGLKIAAATPSVPKETPPATA
jgi:ubiquilin